MNLRFMSKGLLQGMAAVLFVTKYGSLSQMVRESGS